MNKMIAFFTVMFVGSTLISSWMMGGGGVAVTQTNGVVAEGAVEITVDSTVGFLDSGVAFIGEEKIAHTGKTATKLTGVTRGYEGTEDTAHADNVQVYSEDAGVINYALGYNIATVGATSGALSVVVMPWKFLTITVPRIVMWNYSFLQGDMGIIGYFLFAISIGFVITLALAVISVATGIMKR